MPRGAEFARSDVFEEAVAEAAEQAEEDVRQEDEEQEDEDQGEYDEEIESSHDGAEDGDENDAEEEQDEDETVNADPVGDGRLPPPSLSRVWDVSGGLEAAGRDNATGEQNHSGRVAAGAGDNSQSREEVLRGRGNAALVSRLQCVLLEEALADLGVRGPAPPAAWCRALGRLGVSSVQAYDLFGVLDAERTGSVAPSAFCEAELSQEALSGSLQCSLDLVYFIQLRYRLMLLGCQARLGLGMAASVGPADLVAACSKLHLVIDEGDASILIRDFLQHVGDDGTAAATGTIPIHALCHQLASRSMSAPKMRRWTLARERPDHFSSLLGLHGNQHPPVAYVGKTPVDIIVQFKDPATFPWHRLPEAVYGMRFEELWRLSRQDTCHQTAEEAVRLLTDPAPLG
eukprot:TRINITY_DN16409_c0_g1_i1.p1 TRINITY_DN16409_c0_g1~~TRINITY_DN16409_c0_g1_i1.p1  ORF type:complete len:426 (+),score=78.92 TRINITY_DN16409_c0_g1_i1:76-1278(+)